MPKLYNTKNIKLFDDWLFELKQGQIGLQTGNYDFIYVWNSDTDMIVSYNNVRRNPVKPRAAEDFLGNMSKLALFFLFDSIEERDRFVSFKRNSIIETSTEFKKEILSMTESSQEIIRLQKEFNFVRQFSLFDTNLKII